MVRRTALVTAASIAAVVFTGTAAVGANIGILSSADDSPIGDLSATADLAAASPTPIEVVVDLTAASAGPSPTTEAPTSRDDASSARSEAFQVDQAGIAVITVVDRTLVVESVDASPGWSYSPDDDAPDDSVEVRFASGSEVLVLEVDLLDDGTLQAAITRPAGASNSGGAPSTRPPAPAASPTADVGQVVNGSDDESSDDDHGGDEVEDRHDDNEHEGRDDDD